MALIVAVTASVPCLFLLVFLGCGDSSRRRWLEDWPMRGAPTSGVSRCRPSS